MFFIHWIKGDKNVGSAHKVSHTPRTNTTTLSDTSAAQMVDYQPLCLQFCDELEMVINDYCRTFSQPRDIPPHRQRDIARLKRCIQLVRNYQLTPIRFREHLDDMKKTIFTGWLGRSALWKGNRRIKGLLTVIDSDVYRYSAFEKEMLGELSATYEKLAMYEALLKLDKEGEELVQEIYAQLKKANQTIHNQKTQFEQLQQRMQAHQQNVAKQHRALGVVTRQSLSVPQQTAPSVRRTKTVSPVQQTTTTPHDYFRARETALRKRGLPTSTPPQAVTMIRSQQSIPTPIQPTLTPTLLTTSVSPSSSYEETSEYLMARETTLRQQSLDVKTDNFATNVSHDATQGTLQRKKNNPRK